MSTFRLGAAGRVAAAFAHSKLTPLLMLASLLLGVWAVIALPREEEPQIIVPMVDVFVDMPGATPAEIEQRVTRPIEKLLWEVPGVEYIYSTSSSGRAAVIVRFLVGQDEERALVRLNQKLAAHPEAIPPGATPPLVQPRSIDDVPVMALTLSGPDYSDTQLRQFASQLHDLLKEVPGIAEVTMLGGRRRQVTVQLDPAALGARGIDPLAVQAALQRRNVRTTSGPVVAGNASMAVESGDWPTSIEALGRTVVGESHNAPVWLSDVASIADDGGEPTDYVRQHLKSGETRPAITLSISKRKGVNAIELTRDVRDEARLR